MSDIKIIIGAEIKELEQKLAVAKTKLAELGGAAEKSSGQLGGVGSKLASIGKSLITGGIATGVAVITGALIVMVKQFFAASESAEKLRKTNEEIGKSFLKAAEDAGEEIAKVSVLKTVLESENATRLQKATALKELKKINYDYFGQLDIEDGKIKGLSTAYDGYVQRIVRSINAKASVDLLTDAYKDQAKALAQINQNIKAGEERFTAANLTQFQIQDAIRRFGLTFGAKKGETVLIDFKESQLIADLLNAEDRIKSITERIKETIQDAFNPKAPRETKIKADKFIPFDNARLADELPFWSGLMKGPGLKLSPKLIVTPDVTIPPPTPEQVQKVVDGIAELLRIERIEQLAEEFGRQVQQIIGDTITGVAVGIGDVIGSALAGEKDVIPNLFGSLMRNVGSQIQDLGKFLIKSGIQIKIAKEAFQKLLANPIAAIAVGLGLVLLGGLIKAQAAKQYQGFAAGGTVGEGGVYNVGERGMEKVFLPQGARVQPNNEVQAYSGGMGEFSGRLVAEGDQLLVYIDRKRAQWSRNN